MRAPTLNASSHALGKYHPLLVDHNWKENPIGDFEGDGKQTAGSLVQDHAVPITPENGKSVVKTRISTRPDAILHIPCTKDIVSGTTLSPQISFKLQRLGLSRLPPLPRRRRPNCRFVNYIGTRLPSQPVNKPTKKVDFVPSDCPTDAPSVYPKTPNQERFPTAAPADAYYTGDKPTTDGVQKVDAYTI